MQKLRNLLGGRGGGHQKITLDYRGEGGGGLRGPKKDYVIFEWSLSNLTPMCLFSGVSFIPSPSFITVIMTDQELLSCCLGFDTDTTIRQLLSDTSDSYCSIVLFILSYIINHILYQWITNNRILPIQSLAGWK